MTQLTSILLRLAVESAAEAAWRCVDVASAARDRLRGDDVAELRAEVRTLREQLTASERLNRIERGVYARRLMS